MCWLCKARVINLSSKETHDAAGAPFPARRPKMGVPCRKAVCDESLSRVATYSSGGSGSGSGSVFREAQFVGLSGFTVRVETVE